MEAFRQVMYASSSFEAVEAVKNASRCGANYENWRKYLRNLWDRRKLWVLCFRLLAEIRGNNTNNICERTMLLYKENVLHRVLAYNKIALLDFVVGPMEDFYKGKLRDFAYGRITSPHNFLENLVRRGNYIKDASEIKVWFNSILANL